MFFGKPAIGANEGPKRQKTLKAMASPTPAKGRASVSPLQVVHTYMKYTGVPDNAYANQKTQKKKRESSSSSSEE